MQGKSEMDKEDYLLSRIKDKKEKPFYPSALRRYRRYKEFKLPTWSGGLFNQPYLELIEWKVCENAINEHNALKLANLRSKVSS